MADRPLANLLRTCLQNRSLSKACLAVALGAATLNAGASPLTPPVLMDMMDGAQPVLRLRNSSAAVRIVGQSIIRAQSQHGSGAERAVLLCPSGRTAQVAYSLVATPAIDDLHCTATIRCNRPGVQLAVLAVLPRSKNPTTGRPFELLARGASTSAATGWETLSVTQVRRELQRRARVAQAQHGVDVDVREAVVRQLVLLVPGGGGPTELIVDLIRMHGPLAAADATSGSVVPTAGVARLPREGPAASQLTPPGADTPRWPKAFAPQSQRRAAIPRILQYQGEPLEYVRQLGFTAVQMQQPATAAQRTEAARLGLQVVCPPPALDGGLGAAAFPAGDAPDYSAILAWDLGEIANAADLNFARSQRDAIAENPPLADRPVAAWPTGDVRSGSRAADILVLNRPLFGSSLSDADYAAWLRQQRRLARQGTEFWIAIDTHVDAQQAAQLAALGLAEAAPAPASLPDLAAWTTVAFAAGPRGFVFKSSSSLAAADSHTRRRALIAELTNMRIALVEPWLASGKSTTSAAVSRPDMTALALTTERSHLLAPVRWGASAATPQGRATGSPRPEEPVSLLVAGAAESAEAYLLNLGGAERLRSRRVTGGVRVTADRLPADSLVLLTQDGLAFSQVQRRLRSRAERAAALYDALAQRELRIAREALERLPEEVALLLGSDVILSRAALSLAAAATQRAARDFPRACTSAKAALAGLSDLEEQVARQLLAGSPPGAWPINMGWAGLPNLARVVAAAASATPLEPVPGGQFADLASLRQQGWRHLEFPLPGVETTVRLSPEAPDEGPYCLQLEAQPTDEPQRPRPLATPPVWVTSPPLTPAGGSLIEIVGRVRTSTPLIGTPGELLIFDSLGGEQQALRIKHAPSWQTFRLVRAAKSGVATQLTIALSGYGTAEVDSVRFRALPHVAAVRGVARSVPSERAAR